MNTNEFICHRHQTSGQSVQMFMNWVKAFNDSMKTMPPIQNIKVTQQDINEKSQPVTIVRKVEKKPRQHKPYSIGAGSLSDAFKQLGM